MMLPALQSGGEEELLYLSELSRISRRRLADGSPVVVKEMLGANAVRRKRHEARILERLAAVEGVPRLASAPASATELLLQDVAAVPLTAQLQEGKLAIPELARLAAGLAAIVAAMHREGVAHKNINPDNILLTPDGAPLLIDFSLATTFAEERPGFVHHREIAGDLPYLAPEQTGRTGRSLDQRADLYALGATLYRLATGAPPFQHKDPLQLIHDILALVPVPPGWRNPSLPQALNDIIMRLLEKEPDRRYQSAQGLAHDLRLVNAALNSGSAPALILGERDFAIRLSSPSRMVGRERETAALFAAFERCIAGRGSCALVSGAPGVGKSSLLTELRPLVTARRGFFAAGKFDQHRRDLDSDGVYQALRALGRLLLAEPDHELAALRQRLLRGLGANAPLIASLQPEFALLMGLPSDAALDIPLYQKERVVQSAVDLVAAVALPERPVVLVIDDLQWAAPTPVGLLRAVAGEPIPGLLLVGAYRDMELPAGHPLDPLISHFEQGGEQLRLRLDNLDSGELVVFLKEVLRLGAEQAAQLADAVGVRTRGNPYDTVELLNALRREGALLPAEAGWSWDEQAIRSYVGQRDVTEILERRIARLPARAQALLEIMACLGGEMGSELLAVSAGITADELEEQLTPSFQDGLVVTRDGGKLLRFKHDRAQQAAYRRVAAERRAQLHLTLARRLAARPELETLAAEQYLPALNLLAPGEKRDAAALLRRAAARSGRVNLEAAQRFLLAALELVRSLERDEDLQLQVALKTELHAALYGLGRLEEADEVYVSLRGIARDPLELAPAASNQVCSLTNRARPMEAVELGLGMLRELGVVMPAEHELAEKSVAGLGHFISWIGGITSQEDARRPELNHPRALAAARLINRVIPPAFFCDRALVSWWLVIESQRLWVDHGPCAALVGPLSHLSFVSITLAGRYRDGELAVRHVLEVSEARGWEPEASQSRFLYAMTVGPWFRPLQENVLEALRAEEGLVRGGDPQNACFTYYATVSQLLDCAPTLEQYAAELERTLAFTARTGNLHVAASIQPYRRLASLLLGEEGCPVLAEGELESHSTLGLRSLIAALSGALRGDRDELVRHAAALGEYLPYLEATHLVSRARLLQTLALAEELKEAAPQHQEAVLARLDEGRRFLAERSADAPDNFLHLLHWADAERARALGEFKQAVHSFDAALETAARQQRPWQRALICERAARFHLEEGMKTTGRVLMAEARRLFLEWGAAVKVRQLEGEYPFLRVARQAEGESETRTVSGDAIDMLAILRASQALSSETSLERLRNVVTELLLTMTGATAVSLVVREEQADRWFLLPALAPDEGAEPVPLDEAVARGAMPVAVFNVAQRTREPLMVDDATRDDRFRHDRYLADYSCCSILAVPILNHGDLRAVLILENRLSRGAFTRDLVDAVALIAGQLAVSLENALLYQKLEERVRERTRELQEAQSELLAAARHAGMAEIANNVLHNVGNVLNSVNTSAGMISHYLKQSRLSGLSRSVRLMQEHAGDLGEYLTRDAKGRLLPDYLARLDQALAVERRDILDELSRLATSVDHIKEIVSTQQRYSGAASLIEPVLVHELVEDALRMNQGMMARYAVNVEREFSRIGKLPLDKGRVLQILVNLMSNAAEAMDGLPPALRRMTLRVEMAGESRLRIAVADQGTGIAPEHLSLIFSHGFTTKKGGHGFGLHSCALAAREMGGTLSASSAGLGRGACFLLEIPVQPAEGRNAAAARKGDAAVTFL